MTKRMRLFSLASTILVMAILFSGYMPYQGGAPSPYYYTGSPGDGHNCSQCHGNASTANGWITSNIPASGYVPGTSYLITATNTISGSGKYGFEVSPQSNSGTLLGTLAPGTNSKLVGSKWITQSNASNSVTSWTFTWTAPVAGTGSVTFYGSFARSTGSAVKLSTLTVTEQTGGSLPGAAGPISGPSSVCQNSIATFSVGSITGATGYSWSVPAGASITSGQGTTAVTVNFGPSATSGIISVYGTNVSGNGASSSLPVAVNSLPVPAGVITGISTPCAGSTQNYSVTPASGVSYTWFVPGGSAIISGQGSNSIQVLTGNSNGNIEVVPVNSCGSGSGSNLPISISLPPAQPGAIEGTSSPCQSGSVVYSVINATGTIYTWQVPPGCTITGGQGTNSITVSMGNESGNIEVIASNDCGNSLSQSKAIYLQQLPGITASVSGPSEVYLTTTFTSEYSTSGAVNGENYLWELTPAEAGTISGMGLNALATWNTSFTGMVYIRAKALNTCGEGAWSDIKETMLINNTGLDEAGQDQILVYPSPTDGRFTLEIPGMNGTALVRILNISGVELKRLEFIATSPVMIDIQQPTGLYLLVIQTENKIFKKKFLVR